jgi:hypothetical protein
LESLRRDSVDALSRKLHAARAELAERELAARAVAAEWLDVEQRFLSERASFAGAQGVRGLQAIERRLSALEGERRLVLERERHVALAEHGARAQVAALSRALLTAERERRAASGVLESQRLEKLRVSDRVEEEEAEEAFRARR